MKLYQIVNDVNHNMYKNVYFIKYTYFYHLHEMVINNLAMYFIRFSIFNSRNQNLRLINLSDHISIFLRLQFDESLRLRR